MKKRFKKRKKKINSSIFLFLIITLLILKLSLNCVQKTNITNSNKEFINKIMYNSTHYKKSEKNNLFITDAINKLLNVDFSNPLTLLNKMFVDKENNIEENIFMVSINDEKLNDNEKKDIPRIYVYNSHQAEEYSKEGYTQTDITPGVMLATKLFKEKLDYKNINTITENSDLIEFMRINNYTHAYSYVASRYFIEPVIEKNNFDLIIDLHRDSNNKKNSTVTINGKEYAKILFVVGLENENYEQNLKTAEKLNNMVLKKYPTLTRGIYKKEGPGVDGVYNQDLNPNMILLELGGYQNTVSEVTNTIDIMVEIIEKYLENI